MRIFNRSIIKFSVFLTLILLFGQTVLSQETKCLSFNDTLSKLSSTESKNVQQINDDLINEIQKRKVNFVLTATEEKLLKKTGANYSLINTIRANLFNESKEASDLYKIYADITSIESSEIEQAKKLIEVAEEYVRRFEKDECYKEQVNYFKQSIPILKKAIEQKIKQ